MTPPVVWLPEAEAELKAARAWYVDVRLELGERFVRAIDATVRQLYKTHCNSSASIVGCGVPASADFLTEYFLRFKRAGF